MHLPSHPVWFWMVLAAPWVVPFLLWTALKTLNMSIKPLAWWLRVGWVVFFMGSFLAFVTEAHNTARVVLYSAAYSCMGMTIVLERYYKFETLRAPGTTWYFPWKVAGFSVPRETRIVVRNINAVAPWYIDKLGLRKLKENEYSEPDIATFRYKQDGNSFVLTTRGGFHSGKTPILFTRKILKLQQVMAERGIAASAIQLDRQGIQYFEIRDPEGNKIEVVQES